MGQLFNQDYSMRHNLYLTIAFVFGFVVDLHLAIVILRSICNCQKCSHLHCPRPVVHGGCLVMCHWSECHGWSLIWVHPGITTKVVSWLRFRAAPIRLKFWSLLLYVIGHRSANYAPVVWCEKWSSVAYHWRQTWPNHDNFRRVMVDSRGSWGPARILTFCQTYSFVLCSLYDMPSILL